MFVQFAADPIAFTVAQEKTNFFLRDFSIELQKCHFILGLLFFLINENFSVYPVLLLMWK